MSSHQLKYYLYMQKTTHYLLLLACTLLSACYSTEEAPKPEKQDMEIAAKQEQEKKEAEQKTLFEQGKKHYKNREYKEVAECFQKAAEQGLAQAQCNLGVCYEEGQGVKKDEQKAVEWYQKAADQGDAQAQYNLGMCYKAGQGVNQDEQEAVKR